MTRQETNKTVLCQFCVMFGVGLAFFFCVSFALLPMAAEAANLTSVSDTISSSVPGVNVNHAVKFTVTNTIPASGKIIVTPQTGAFTMPAGLDYTDIDFSDDGANQILSMSPGSGNGGAIGISIITGTSSSITFTLNNTDALAAGSVIIIKIGANAAFGEIGDQQIQNPATAGSYKINIKTYDNSNTLIDQADAMAAILSPVQIGAPLKALATFSAIFSPATATTTTLVNPDGTKFSIDFPQGFLDFLDDIRLQISSYQKEDFSPTASPPSGKSAVGKVYDIRIYRVLDGSAITSFSKNIILNFFYSDNEISGIDESTLRPYRWDGSQWVLVPGSAVFSGENKVTVSVNHFTVFVLMGEPPVEAAPAPTPAGGGGGGGGGVITPFVPTENIGAGGSAIISVDSGGYVKNLNPDGSFMKLYAPSNFWVLPTTFTINTISKKTVLSLAPLPLSLTIVGDQVYSIFAKDTAGLEITRFLKPLTVTIYYTDAQISGFDEKTLRLYFLNQISKKWEFIPDSSLDRALNTVSGSVDHLTLFAVMGQATKPAVRVADLNQDKKVDLVDFSILLYNWGVPKNKAADINKDGRVDLVDFSILLYWWTG